MKKELEKYLAQKIIDFTISERLRNNGIVPEASNSLLLDFYNYSLSHGIDSKSDIPKKYSRIFN